MTVRLRAHHLLCMLTYVGKGYSPAFCAGFDAIARRLSDREEILIVEGPDDVCRPLLGEEGAHCHRPGVLERDRRAAAAVSALLDRPIAPGERLRLDPRLLARLRRAFAAGTIRTACGKCEWAELCTGIAANGYAGIRLDMAKDVEAA
ncbi:DUF1284 domain-containing protein [Geminicoccus harenae]|uniref:DUF1284 domain-containing protein n=2 Tax=Geminicoccus harenae TaxID=2498453 RepID=UPI001C96D15D|nr:DUF1284 domain-containing protein [Geminicoccus harenae]